MRHNQNDIEGRHAFSQRSKKFKIGISIAMMLTILYISYFEKASYPTYLIWILIAGLSFYTIVLIKRLKLDELPVQVQNIQNNSRAPIINEISRRTMQDMGFSEHSIAKSNQLMQKHFADLSAISNQKQIMSQSDLRGQSIIQPSFNILESRSQYRDSRPHDVSKHEKSILDMVNDAYTVSPLARYRTQQTRVSQQPFREPTGNESTYGFNNRESSLIRSSTNAAPARKISTVETGARKDSKISLSKAKISVNKVSITSKSDIRREIQNYDKIAESDFALEKQLIDMNVNFEKFNYWARNNLQIWLAFQFIPELIKRNLTNFREINDALRARGKELKEYKVLNRMIEDEGLSNQTEFNAHFRENRSEAPEKLLRSVTIEELMPIHGDPVLEPLLYKRMNLDQYLAPCGFQIEKTRIYVLKQLLSMQRDNFSIALEQNLSSELKHLPLDFEILLNAFVYYIMEMDSFFDRHLKNRATLFATGLKSIARPAEYGFFFHVSPKQITCHLSNTSLAFIKNQAGVFSLMTFVLFYITENHSSMLRNVPDSAFSDLMRRFEFQ